MFHSGTDVPNSYNATLFYAEMKVMFFRQKAM